MTQPRLCRQFMRHNPTGQIWAMETRDGVIRAVVGPLGRTEVDPVLLQYLPYDVRDVGWIRLHANEFTPLEGEPDVTLPPRKAPAKTYIPLRAKEQQIG